MSPFKKVYRIHSDVREKNIFLFQVIPIKCKFFQLKIIVGIDPQKKKENKINKKYKRRDKKTTHPHTDYEI